MIKILFVCLGNICRSPMAEYVMKSMVQHAGREGEFRIASAATGADELGNPVYPPVRRLLTKRGIDCTEKTARQLTKEDYQTYDLLIGADSANIRNMQRICGGDPLGKISRLLDHTDCPGDVADPWYTRDFEQTWHDVQAGCRALLQALPSSD